jgi:hypothetical protein
MEKFEDIEKIEAEADLRKIVSVEMQLKLIEQSLNNKTDRTAHGLEWISTNAELFRKAFDQLVAEDPDLLVDWDIHDSGEARAIEDIDSTPEREKILKKVLLKMEELRDQKFDRAA